MAARADPALPLGRVGKHRAGPICSSSTGYDPDRHPHWCEPDGIPVDGHDDPERTGSLIRCGKENLILSNLSSIIGRVGNMPAETGRIPAGQPASTSMHRAFTPEAAAILGRPELQGVPECGTLPVLPALRELLPRGGLARGSVVEVAEFGLLCLALLGGASAAGAWCGIAGLPEAGVQAAVGLGLAAERTLLVPDPGRAWPQVVASLLEGCEIVLLRPPEKTTAQIRRRLEATLRRGRGVLLVTGDWPGAQVRLQVVARRWTGLGDGNGRLRACCAEVAADGRGKAVMSRTRWLWLPTEDGAVTVADAADLPAEFPAAGLPSARPKPVLQR
jgi:hypothetical protein